MNAVFSRCLALAAALGLSLAASAQQDFSKVEVKTEKLNETTYMLVGAGGNLGLSVGEDAVYLIDDQYAPMTPRIQAAIAAITPKPVKFVLNTHWHGDHTGGNENMGKAGAIIVAHENVRRRMDSEQFIQFFRMKVPRAPRVALPLVTFSTDVTFHINGDEVRVFHVPAAHTDGDALVHFARSDVVHMGDVFFNWMYPFIDGDSGGTVEGVIAASDRVIAMTTDKTKIIPGHGPLANREDLRAYRDMLSTVLGRMKKMIQDGKKLEEIVAAKPTADFDAKWGGGFMKADKFVELLAVTLIKR
jgi:glyoxylase-like metal-dependent hydrolase (beta-lactamase superfamily II)